MLTLIHGENIYFSEKKLKEIKGNYFTNFEPKDFDFSIFTEKATAASLFNETENLILKGFLSERKKDSEKQINNFLGKNQPQNNIIFYEEKTIKTGSLFKIIEKKGQVFHFPELKNRGLKKWIETEFAKEKMKIDPELPEIMLNLIGSDMFLLQNEIEKIKLHNYDSSEITLKDYEKLSFLENSGNIFDFVDHLGNRYKRESFQSLHQILRSNQSPHYLLSMIIRQYRLLIQIKALSENHLSYSEIKNQMQLHPFVIGKLFKQSQSYSYLELKKIYANLLNIDSQSKIGENAEVLIELFIEKICS